MKIDWKKYQKEADEWFARPESTEELQEAWDNAQKSSKAISESMAIRFIQ